MNNLSFSELCCLFCCPPCPGKIASKLAFLPPDPTYTLMCDESGRESYRDHALSKTGLEWGYLWELHAAKEIPTRQCDGESSCTLSGKSIRSDRFSEVPAHSACSVGINRRNWRSVCSHRVMISFWLLRYGGIAHMSGMLPWMATKPLGWTCQEDEKEYGIRPENVIIYGQSIGTVPSVDLAARYESAAVILHSPLTSGMRVAFPDTKKTYCFDAFPNIDKISKITSPVLIIHGTEDEVIDFSHGLALFERCQRPVEPLWVEGAGHNDVELYGQYLERLKQFVSQELVNL
ncbi:AB17B protein, partial [Nothocercus nigrocapillus]|nr:AB17B protein [Nothocercus nigrocapillus]